MEPGWKTLATEALCRTPHLAASRETIATPSRPHGVDWVVVRRPAAVVVAPRLEDGRFVLIRQERPAVRRVTWEFPAGQIDGGGSEAAARRELREEAGIESPHPLVPLGQFYSSVGFTDERADLFLATGCRAADGDHQHDEHEAILGTRAVDPVELGALIASGDLCDANTLCAYARLRALGQLA